MQAQVSTADTVTWVGVLSGGVPVAAVALLAVYFLVRRLDVAMKRIDELQEQRLVERDTLLREMLPVLKGSGEALVRATVLWDRQANQAGGL